MMTGYVMLTMLATLLPLLLLLTCPWLSFMSLDGMESVRKNGMVSAM